MRPVTAALAALATMAAMAYVLATAPAPASALSLDNPVCGAAGVLSSAAESACAGIGTQAGGKLLTAGKQLATGHPVGAVNTVVSGAAQTVASTASTALGLAVIGGFVLGGAQAVLTETASALGTTTAPQLRTTWFSATYWRMTAIAAVLALPFLFAAAVQALIRSDLGLLVRSAFGYLPLAMLAIAVAAPLTMLLLAATDELCVFISSAAGDASAHFLAKAGVLIGGLTALTSSPFLAVLVGLFMIGAAFALWIELLVREAAVYVIVLMLPLAFAAMVWPARRVWAIRAVELLVALIFSKFAIVAVLSLGGAAISSGADHGSVTAVMAGAVLILLAAFSPWVLLRMIPLAELASGAAGTLRGELGRANVAAGDAWAGAHEWSDIVTAAMRRDAADGGADPGGAGPGGADPGGADPGPSTQTDHGRGDGPPEPPGDGAGDPGPGNNGGGPNDPPAEEPLNWDDEPVLELSAENLFATPARPFDDAGRR
ncbi:MAG TPA: hypothetical protein VHZ27_06855 [Solirubrobacteraceae bacterium]|nr:hypothetical protein [Solirubrobacteraceae bacterium]